MGTGSCIALVGAGGKTTVMLALAEDLASIGRRALVTTTTKIWPPHPIPLVCTAEVMDVRAALAAGFARSPLVALGRHIGPDGKLYGVDPSLICTLRSTGVMDIMLCEADGAAGKPAKAHRAGEPVVPACTTYLLAVSGVDAVGRQVDDRTVHRVEEFCRVTGATVGEPLLPQHLAASLRAMLGYRPARAMAAILVNKVDDAERQVVAREVVESLIASFPVPRVIMASHGRAVETSYLH